MNQVSKTLFPTKFRSVFPLQVMTRSIFILAFLLVAPLGVSTVLAQESPTPTGSPTQYQPPFMPGSMGMPANGMGSMGMPPAMLLKMRNQLTFEYQQTQRTLGFIDPADTQLIATLKAQQEELLSQLKSINAQLSAQGIPGTNDSAPGLTPDSPSNVPPNSNLPGAKASGTDPSQMDDPNLLIQRRQMPPGMMPPPSEMPGMASMPGMPAMPSMREPAVPLPPLPTTEPGIPTEFDQDQAWADSPWAPQPSKELNQMKQSVELLRKELAEMKESIKALEVQIQLLNKNILLSQPKQ